MFCLKHIERLHKTARTADWSIREILTENEGYYGHTGSSDQVCTESDRFYACGKLADRFV